MHHFNEVDIDFSQKGFDVDGERVKVFVDRLLGPSLMIRFIVFKEFSVEDYPITYLKILRNLCLYP